MNMQVLKTKKYKFSQKPKYLLSPNPQSPIPNPQSPIPKKKFLYILNNLFLLIIIKKFFIIFNTINSLKLKMQIKHNLIIHEIFKENKN